MIKANFKLVILPDEVKAANRVKSKARLDCVYYSGVLLNFKKQDDD